MQLIYLYYLLYIKLYIEFLKSQEKKASDTPCYQFRKELKKLLEIIGLPGYIKELVKLSRIREALWF